MATNGLDAFRVTGAGKNERNSGRKGIDMDREELLTLMRARSYRPLTTAELMATLGIDDAGSFQELLHSLEQEGLIVRTRKDKYGLPEKMGLVSGRLQASPRGFAFVVPPEKGREDLYISALNINGAMHGDLVLARVLPGNTGPRQEGEIIRVLQRVNKRVVGTFDATRNLDFVIPDDTRLHQDIIIPAGASLEARDRDKVVVEITRWPEARRNPEGRVIQVLGQTGEPGVDVLSIIKKYGLEPDFPPEVVQEAAAIPEEINQEELARRRDLRDWSLVTIDGADARDLDDAVSLELRPDGSYLLGVHIADVSLYVREGGPLDREAFNRATSVYFVDRVIPMLPARLSNGICSLNAGEDRLALTALMTITPTGTIQAYELFPSVIRVRERMTYDDVRRLLEEKDPDLTERYRELVPTFQNMARLAAILRRRRRRRGAIDFDFPEAKVKLDDQGLPVAIIPRQRSVAEGLIEEFMIAANEVVARHLYELAVPAVYRVHEEPAPDKLEDLNSFLAFFGFHLKPNREGRVKPRAFQEILKVVKGRPEERVISTVMLRSMMHARYAGDCLGHFGLASPYYCHFTSPIRRYPDLVVHRVLRETWSPGGIPVERMAELDNLVNLAAVQASEREKLAEEAERESLDMKKVQYMERHVGSTFAGVISGVVPYGFFVELENTVEGLVHVSTLTDDYYHYQEDQLTLVGEHTGRSFRIGQPVEVVVTRANVDARQVDFELVKQDDGAPGGPAVKTGGQRQGLKAGDKEGRSAGDKTRGRRSERAGGKAGARGTGSAAGRAGGKEPVAAPDQERQREVTPKKSKNRPQGKAKTRGKRNKGTRRR
ncbi:ribonuclease R [Moorella sp. Hama-1]|nr:ribonuclease R [Moorella sp. Hama-1]MDN5361261.1 ribonuclease [Moorella sp. (in: firmicutes)]BCV20202.1 ribonuclease R [Moorella sp. Hama-1]